MSFRRLPGVVLAWIVVATAVPAASQPMQYEVLHAFDRPPVRAPYGALLRASDGTFYGPMSDGGDRGLGALIRYDPRASRDTALAVAHAFSGPDGARPYASLIEGPGGKLYGTTYFGGANDRGTIYRYDLSTRALTTLYSFEIVPAFPYGGLLLATDGMLYGAAGSGGPPGAFFRFDLSTSTLTVLHAYGGQSGDGGWPAAAPVQAADGRIYGTAGAMGPPVIYRYDPTTGAYATVHVFVVATGYQSYAPLIQASDGFLYGTTIGGGTHTAGVLFRFDPATSAYAALHHFGPATGATPFAAVHQGPDGALYGTTDRGGLHGRGTLFRYDLATGALTVLEHFDGKHGASPRGAVIDAGDGTLLGTAVLGGVGLGTIYRYDPAAASVTTQHRFLGRGGANPYAGLVEGSDGALYGTTADGGLSGEGTVFRYQPATGAATLHSFAGSTGRPMASLIRGADDKLYGTTRGGAPSGGTIYRYDPATAALATLHNFTSYWGAETALVQASDGAFYGTTASAGTPQTSGSIFRFDLATGAVTTLHLFDWRDSEAASALIEGADGALYGTTDSWWNSQLFRLDQMSSPPAFATLHPFLHSARAAVLQAADGSFYGTTADGGSANAGTVFAYDPGTATYRTVFSFTPATGSIPVASLVQRADGALFGTTQRGGASDEGTIFRVDASGAHTMLHSFSRNDGARPAAALFRGADGAFYGTTVEGGPFGGGVLFRLRPVTTATKPASPTSR